jgi:hypothetical protein
MQKRLLPLACLLVLTSLISHAKAQTIWLSPQSGAAAVPDYMDLFRPDAPWASAASHVSVFSVSAEFLVHRPDSELQQLFADLKRRHIKFGAAMSPLSARPSPDAPECGIGVEGFSAPGEALMIARKVKQLGGTIDYYTMDEPLFFGHVYTEEAKDRLTKRAGCHLPISEIAQDAAKRITDVRSVFPEAKVGDAEPIKDLDDGDISQWLAAFQSATGERLAYFRLDMIWRSSWQVRMGQLVKLLHSKQVPLQVIYDGTSFAASDRIWVDEAAQRFKEFEGANGISPEAVVMQSWHERPSRVLPESDPGTLTNLVIQYVNWKRSRGQAMLRN